jgi:hypothetical protein
MVKRAPSRTVLFDAKSSLSEMMDNVEKLQKSALLRSLDGYEGGIVDGLPFPATQALK